MRLGISTSIRNAPALAAAGADFIEENIQSLLVPEQPDEAFAPNLAAAKAAPVPVRAANCFLPGALKCVGPAVDLPRLTRYGATAFRRAAQVGIERLVFGSGAARQLPDGFPRERAEEQVVELLRALGPLAAEQGVVLVVEPLNSGECNFINSLAEGARVVAAADSPGVRLLADIFHMLRDAQPPADIVAHGARLAHVHLAERAQRTAPGVAGDDFRPYLRALRTVGYAGALAIESGWTDLPAQAGPSLAGLRQQLHESGF